MGSLEIKKVEMKKIGVTLLMVFGFLFSSIAGTIVLEGKYQQRNIFVINSVAEAGVGFCVYEVTVTGDITTDEINSHAFEIDLSIFGFKLGDDVSINIKYKEGCEPKVLNPGALEPQPTFETLDIDVSDGGMLTWVTSNEQGKIPFVIQQFKWNKWVNVGEVMGKGTSIKNEYSYQVNPVSGINKVRVIQRSYEGKTKKSPSIEFTSDKAEVTYTYDAKAKTIELSTETNYEIYNVYGQIIKRGFGKSVDVSGLVKSDYYISYDSLTDKFTKK